MGDHVEFYQIYNIQINHYSFYQNMFLSKYIGKVKVFSSINFDKLFKFILKCIRIYFLYYVPEFQYIVNTFNS